MLRRAALVVVFALLPLGVLAACSDPAKKPAPAEPGNPPPPTLGGGPGEGGTDAQADAARDAGDGGVCNDVPLGGNVIDRIAVASDPPVATGGTVVDGLYDLTDYTAYLGPTGVAGPTGIVAKASIRILGTKFDELYQFGGTGKPTTTTRTASTYSATGATVASTQLCPALGSGKQRQFTSNPPLLVLTDLVTKEAFTFTKR